MVLWFGGLTGGFLWGWAGFTVSFYTTVYCSHVQSPVTGQELFLERHVVLHWRCCSSFSEYQVRIFLFSQWAFHKLPLHFPPLPMPLVHSLCCIMGSKWKGCLIWSMAFWKHHFWPGHTLSTFYVTQCKGLPCIALLCTREWKISSLYFTLEGLRWHDSAHWTHDALSKIWLPKSPVCFSPFGMHVRYWDRQHSGHSLVTALCTRHPCSGPTWGSSGMPAPKAHEAEHRACSGNLLPFSCSCVCLLRDCPWRH